MQLLNFDPLIKMSEVEVILGKVFVPAPSRPTIVAWLEGGTLDGRQVGPGNNWFVYQSSLQAFIAQVASPRQYKMAA